MSSAAGRGGLGAQHLEELLAGRDAAAGAQHRLDEYGGQVGPVLADQRPGAVDVVVVREHPLVRDRDRARRIAEGEHAAVVAAPEDQDLPALGDRHGQRDRHQVGLGAGVGEPHQVEAREPRADQLAQPRLEVVDAAEVEPAVQCIPQGVEDHPLRVAVEPGGELAEEVDVAIAVQRPQVGVLAALERERERLEVQDRPGVAARHRLRRALVARRAARVAVDVPLDLQAYGVLHLTKSSLSPGSAAASGTPAS